MYVSLRLTKPGITLFSLDDVQIVSTMSARSLSLRLGSVMPSVLARPLLANSVMYFRVRGLSFDSTFETRHRVFS